MKKIFTRQKSQHEPCMNNTQKASAKIWRAATFFLAILLSCYIAILPKPSFAQELGAQDINLHSWTQISALDIVSGLNCQIIGYDPANAKNEGKGCVAYNQEGKLVMMEKAGGGAVAFTGNLIAAMYANPPASGVTYLADLGRNLGLATPAYAQGTGFSGLSPILPIWKAFRNIAYLFFTIVFIVIGFAIMFRVKISPQAVVTIQSALPRMIIALILVTFSYAIAGFLIDLMYVAIFLVITFLAHAGIPSIGPGDIPGLQAQFTGGFEGAILGVFQVVGNLGFLILGGIIGGIIGALAGPGLLPVTLVGIGLFFLVFGVIIFFLIFKLFVELLKAYIGIIFAVIFAPLQIMLGAIPGQSGFGGWFRGLLANILVFPAVAIFLLIGRSLMSMFNIVGTGLWVPPMFSFPSTVIPAILALGILFLVVKVPEMVKNAFQVKPFPYGAAIGEAMGTGPGLARLGGQAFGSSVAGRFLPPPPPAGAPPQWYWRLMEFGRNRRWWS